MHFSTFSLPLTFFSLIFLRTANDSAADFVALQLYCSQRFAFSGNHDDRFLCLGFTMKSLDVPRNRSFSLTHTHALSVALGDDGGMVMIIPGSAGSSPFALPLLHIHSHVVPPFPCTPLIVLS
jgi:hypothetical protein